MKINITAALLSKLNVLSSEYNIEVGGYLTGEAKNGEIYLDDLLIPDQTISTVSVNITSRDQVNLLKKYGKKCRRIIGHWHSHHSMGCFWSTTDERDMANVIESKDLYLFMVSSLGNHKIRLYMKRPLDLQFDDVKLHVKTVMLDQLRLRVNKLIKGNSERNSVQKEIEEVDIKIEEEEEEEKEETYYG